MTDAPRTIGMSEFDFAGHETVNHSKDEYVRYERAQTADDVTPTPSKTTIRFSSAE